MLSSPSENLLVSVISYHADEGAGSDTALSNEEGGGAGLPLRWGSWGGFGKEDRSHLVAAAPEEVEGSGCLVGEDRASS